jgi:hypothetical protein
MKTGCALLAVAGALLPLSASAQFTLIDHFNAYTPNSQLIGPVPAGDAWNLTIDSPTGMVVRAVSGSDLATYVGPTGPSAAYRALGPAGVAIPNSSTAATVFWQFSLGSTINNNWNFVLTDVNPTVSPALPAEPRSSAMTAPAVCSASAMGPRPMT